jgi:hypothetical protein
MTLKFLTVFPLNPAKLNPLSLTAKTGKTMPIWALPLLVLGFPGNFPQRYQAFTNQELDKFQQLVNQAERIVGFNSLSFDDKLLLANGIKITTNFDLLCQVRKASQQPPHYTKGVTRKGYSLENLAIANLGVGKTGTGELAPVLWQQGRYQEVISYCLNDVKLTKRLYYLFLSKRLYDPTNGRKLPYKTGNWTKIEVRNWQQKAIALFLGGEAANPRQEPNCYFLEENAFSHYQWLLQES